MHISTSQSTRLTLKGDICNLECCGKGSPGTDSAIVLAVSSTETQSCVPCILGNLLFLSPPTTWCPESSSCWQQTHSPAPASAPHQSHSSHPLLFKQNSFFFQDWDICFVLRQHHQQFSHQSTERMNEKLLTVLDTQEASVMGVLNPHLWNENSEQGDL